MSKTKSPPEPLKLKVVVRGVPGMRNRMACFIDYSTSEGRQQLSSLLVSSMERGLTMTVEPADTGSPGDR